MNNNTVVVGVDGSEHGLSAARWAAREAQRRGAALHVVLVYEWAWPGAMFTSSPPLEKEARERANTLLATAVAQAKAAAREVTVTGEAVRGRPAGTLIKAAVNAALLVVGNRGHGGFVNLAMGSISMQVATHASCPVVVVRGHADRTAGPVIVGVDGSPGSEHAIEAAFEAASARGSDLIAIRVHQLPLVWGGYGVAPEYIDPTKIEDGEREGLTEAVATWRDKYPDVPVRTLVARGSTADVLVGVSRAAQLVVVGTRGHGGFAGLLLGSVGQQLLHHSESPVLIAR